MNRVITRLNRLARAPLAKALPYARSSLHVHYSRTIDGKEGTGTYALDRVAPRELLPTARTSEVRTLGKFRIIEGSPGFLAAADLLTLPASSHRSAGLFDRSGTVVPESICLTSIKTVGPPPRIDPAEHSWSEEERPAVYLGFIFDQFGHFLFESLSRAWILPEIDPAEYVFVFHSQVEQSLRTYMREILDVMQIPLDRIVICDRPTRFRNITVPRQAIAGYDATWTCFTDLAARIGAEIARPLPDYDPLQPIYFSKERANTVHSIRGETELVEALRRQGIRIVYPEEVSIRDRISLYNHCHNIVGIRSSAFHLNLFAARPVHHVYLARAIDRRYLMHDAVRGNRATWILVEGWSRDPSGPPQEKSLVIDPRRCSEAIERIRW